MYVEAYGDDIVGNGTRENPVKTLDKAIELVSNCSEDTAEIIIGEGIYPVENAVTLSYNQKLPKEKLIIRAAEGDTPTLAGGVAFTVGDAFKVEDEATLGRLTDSSVREKLYAIDLTEKIPLDKIPGVNLPGSYSYFIDWVTEGKTNCEMILDGQLMTIARYPNSGYANISSVVDEGAAPRCWEDDYIGRPEYVEEADRDQNDVFVIGYDYENADNWATADQALMFGYWKYDWATQTVPLAKVDTVNKILTSKYPSYYSVNKGARYYVYNLLEEIDTKGEYFIDRTTGLLYFYMDDSYTNDMEVVITAKDTDIMYLNNVNNVEIDGLTFTGSSKSGIRGSGKNITIKNCIVSNTASTAVSMTGTNILIDNNEIYDVNGGIAISGGNTKTLTPSGNVVSNNEITRFSRLTKTYTPGVECSGVGNLITNNEIHDGEHIALRYSGNEHMICYNEIYDVCKESDDTGAIYVGRSWINRGNKIISNYFHDLYTSDSNGGSPIGGIFFDDHYAGAYVEGNVFENIGGTAIRCNGGREHTIKNNVYINCKTGFGMSNSSVTSDYQTHKNSLASSPYQSDVWKEKYPGLYNILNNNPSYPMDNIYKNNLSVNCTTHYSLGNLIDQYAKDISGNVTYSTDPGFSDMANKDYTLTAETMKDIIPGFTTIEFGKMGRNKNN